MDFDLYDLLGIDSSSDQSQIKMAYRTLQKRCHPDIAGRTGHDMAIILNEAYSILSDPNSRLAYDKEHMKIAEFSDYTGKPLYSTWFGSESEERAVFVDEIKCVGCLKCALFAENTFAIESVYGRARVVGQWADPEDKIYDAIQTCPVDCISIVERSNLAALEFLMSKQPRVNVRMTGGNNGGVRVANVFVDVKKFQSRFSEASKQDTMDLSHQKEAMMSAIHTIRSISNWLYWQMPNTGARGKEPRQNLLYLTDKSNDTSTKKLRDAAAARQNFVPKLKPHATPTNEYWKPSDLKSSSPYIESNPSKTSKPSQTTKSEDHDRVIIPKDRERASQMREYFPLVTFTVATFIIGLQRGERVVGDGIKDHIGGSRVLDVVNSSWFHAILGGLTWYLVGIAMVELVEAFRSGKQRGKRD
ncbi:hypothetical protein GIB67_003471 [Kingdonia uniflora]|uniref:J domain-containing protein n=1 Tax=Kingdonia uniflora TaxID=39325 RepID=A0A7J7MEI6_9MAGN|nr:hypothetical protein GIB67_003471 [Kingdonia uniflora]